MTWFSQPIAEWLTHRLADASVVSLLPDGAASIYRGTRPQASGAPPLFVAFDQRGDVVLSCLPGGKDGLQARYGVQAWQAGDDSDSLAPLAAAIDARLAGVAESYRGYQFVSEPLQEVSTGAAAEGVQYVTAGGLYQITAEVA